LIESTGNIFDKYTKIRYIGNGSFGTVYLIKRIEDGKYFAMKVLDL
jgi:hypothetical protein